MNWKPLDGSYVYINSEPGFFSKGGPQIEKVPATEMEGLNSSLLGLMEKKRFISFIKFVS